MMNTKYICKGLETTEAVLSEKINEFNERIEVFLSLLNSIHEAILKYNRNVFFEQLSMCSKSYRVALLHCSKVMTVCMCIATRT